MKLTVATGEGDLMFLGMLQTLPHVKIGRVKVIAISSKKRDSRRRLAPHTGQPRLLCQRQTGGTIVVRQFHKPGR